VSLREIFDLTGRVALIPGGTGGIGAAIAQGLADFGAKIAIVGRSLERGEAVAAELRGHDRQAIAIQADITDESQAIRMVDETVQKLGSVDILVNCVGTNVEAPAESFSLEDWRRVMDLNLTSMFLACRSAGKVMIQKRRGKIINISSVRGQLAIRRGYSAYCPSKAGVNLLTKQLATEWAKYGINVNAIAPTFIKTPLVAPMLSDPGFYESLVSRIPLGRVGETTDLVGAAVFLSSSASDFITGHVLLIDGGVTATQ
jgi:gluconate 5-dehydrogenase